MDIKCNKKIYTSACKFSSFSDNVRIITTAHTHLTG